MNSKTVRKYELIVGIAGGEDALCKIQELCAIDFQTAFEMWEFALMRGREIVESGLTFFNSTSETRTRQLFCESIPLQKLVYSSSEAARPRVIEYLANLILINKLDTADECLNRLRTNTHLDFNEILRVVIDATFALYCQRNNTRVPVFNKKQKTLMQDHVNKMRGPNKALLLQRIKEI